MKRMHREVHFAGMITLLVLLIIAAGANASAQQEVKWLAAGSLQNWFSNLGCEIEVGRSSAADQQDGLQWPGWYPYQDCQAAKGFWIGLPNYKDVTGTTWAHKVVHIGPRVRPASEFIPIKFEMVSKYAPPEVIVDGSPTEGKAVDNNRVDPAQVADRMIVNVVNTSIGVTMTRKIMQFSNQFHDNYMIFDFTFTNTGNINADPAIEMPTQTLSGLYFYWQYRYAPTADVRYVIGNPTSWGKASMNDTRGDGYKLPTTNAEDTDDAVNIPGVYTAPHMRAQFTWQGKFPPFTQYDNMGGPIWVPYYDKTDTTGRLGAPHFVGHVTIHADVSATDTTDDFSQPRTTSWEGSDEPNTSGNSEFNGSKMTDEYTNWMLRGHYFPRHAWQVEPAGKFNAPSGDPSFNDAHAQSGAGGGFSSADGYGPYTLAPGQSVHIVIAEAAAGLSRQKCIDLGRAFKAGQLGPTGPGLALQKNDSVLTGKDSLFQTFRRAIGNYKSGFKAPPAPTPPSYFSVTSGEPIVLTWDVTNAGDPNLKGFKIFRATGRYDAEYAPIYMAGPTDRTYNDAAAQRGVGYFYYIVAIGDPALNTGAALTPKDTLYSNRVYTQTFTAAYLKQKRPVGQTMADIRIVPNPYVLSADPTNLLFPSEQEKIAFFNIPGRCNIKIFTELGEKIYEFDHTDGSGDAYWLSVTSSRQVVVSGIYIVVFENMDTGERALRKLSIIR
jgi:hypothetical protein